MSEKISNAVLYFAREAVMTQRSQHRKNGAARPIRTKRDYVQAGDIVKNLNQEIERGSVTELRLQALIHEMEQYDGEADDYGSDFSLELDNGDPRRRWSDDPNDLD
jgi:hypothetical protein